MDTKRQPKWMSKHDPRARIKAYRAQAKQHGRTSSAAGLAWLGSMGTAFVGGVTANPALVAGGISAAWAAQKWGDWAVSKKKAALGNAAEISDAMRQADNEMTVQKQMMARPKMSGPRGAPGAHGPGRPGSMAEIQAGFNAANSRFTKARAGAATPKRGGGKSDGYVDAHTRRQGTKAVQVKKHQRKPR